jgi:hypothetical protein
MRLQGNGHRAHVLSRRREKHEVGAFHRGRHVAGGADAWIEGDASKEKVIGPLAIDRGHHLGLACPETHLVAGPAQHASHRRTESTAANDADPRHGIML